MKREPRRKKSAVSWLREIDSSTQKKSDTEGSKSQPRQQSLTMTARKDSSQNAHSLPRTSDLSLNSTNESIAKKLSFLEIDNCVDFVEEPKNSPYRSGAHLKASPNLSEQKDPLAGRVCLTPDQSPISNVKNNFLHHRLTTDDRSWLDVFDLPQSLLLSREEFSALWEMHPQEIARSKAKGQEFEAARYVQSFGKSYFFAGLDHEATPLPPILQRYVDYANQTKYVQNFNGSLFNMCLVNWYVDGSHYIVYHSDEGPFVENRKGERVVFSISFGGTRRFSLMPKSETDETDVRARTVTVPLKHGSVAVMGGLCQQTHVHSVLKVRGEDAQNVPPRINLTLRMFQ